MGAGRCEERDPEWMRQICLKARDRLEAEMRQDHQKEASRGAEWWWEKLSPEVQERDVQMMTGHCGIFLRQGNLPDTSEHCELCCELMSFIPTWKELSLMKH